MSLYQQYFYSSQLKEILSDEAFLYRLLQFEVGLAQSQAAGGIIEQVHADNINNVAKSIKIDIEQLKREIPLSGNVAIPLLSQLKAAIKIQYPTSVDFIHLGATSQDMIDTAYGLTFLEFIQWLEADCNKLLVKLNALIIKHKFTWMVGRTLLQQATPITFGYKAARWMAGFIDVLKSIKNDKHRICAITLGGAVGGGNEFISEHVEIELAKYLNLSISNMNENSRFGLLACHMGLLNGAISKIIKDISLMMQTEVAELSEYTASNKGGSSTMPHKQNPVTVIAVISNTSRVPFLVANLLSSMSKDHERSAGLWHADWEPMNELLGLVGGAITNLNSLIDGLQVHPDTMKHNLDLTNGLVYAENISFALSKKLGKEKSKKIIEEACLKAIKDHTHLREVLANTDIDFDEDLFLPENAIGYIPQKVDKILNLYSVYLNESQ